MASLEKYTYFVDFHLIDIAGKARSQAIILYETVLLYFFYLSMRKTKKNKKLLEETARCKRN